MLPKFDRKLLDAPRREVNLISLPYLDVTRGRKTFAVSHGTTLGEMVAISRPELTAHAKAKLYVTIDGMKIEPGVWHLVRPKPGTSVIIRNPVPGNIDLRTILSVVVLVAAVALGQYYLGPAIATQLSVTAGTFGASAINAASVAAVAFAGNALVNALVPVRGLNSQDTESNIYSITGLQNSANPGGVIPSVLGYHRYAPPYVMAPYTEVIGDDMYVTAAFLIGHGPVVLRNHRLGETSIAEYSDVEMEVRDGSTFDPLTLCPQTVIEDQLSVNLTFGNSVTRLSPRDITEMSIDLTFAQGLVEYDSKTGDKRTNTVAVQIFQRKLGDVSWDLVQNLLISSAQQRILRRGFRWSVPVRGQYEVQVTRQTPDATDTKVQNRCDLTAFRGFRPEYPINYPFPVAMVAVRIKATDQLNGVVNNYNCDVSLVCPDWDASSGTWVTRETNSPASLFRYVLQGPGTAAPKPDFAIDIAALQDWHSFNEAKGLRYNRVHDYDATRLDVLADIAGAGRASPHDDGSQWTVVIDRAQTIQIAAISPRNSWDFQGETPYIKLPDAFRCQFIDETNGYSQAERIVPFPGVNIDDVQVTEDLGHPGITDPALIWIETRRRQYELIHRPHTYTVSQDFEAMVMSRGGLAALSHDVLGRAQVAGRLKGVSGQTLSLDTVVTMEQGTSYGCHVRLSNGTILQRPVLTSPGETQTLHIIGDTAGFDTGDLFMFGVLQSVTLDVVVKAIERGDNLTAKLTLYDAAPQIDDLTAAEVAPPWDGRVGEIINLAALQPDIPVLLGGQSSLDAGAYSLVVYARPGPDLGAIAPASFVFAHRLSGGGAFTEVTFPVSNGAAVITGYTAGERVDVTIRGVSRYGASGLTSAVTTYSVASGPRSDSTSATVDSINLKADSF
ncbi:host specificity factor TipJ family phage tail protein [Tardiphaga sp.]|uniref:host specificity factor TipJ family phage tail protein n=1 Tax=Tardiphaga sp. TaxID=1926292 RepID=UPI00262953CC|nr:host specificity factor TipJ family phage tail protein [Tardiphaga sp.]MDB5620504.1 hypothetical protein [Tardiphaga sp.]